MKLLQKRHILEDMYLRHQKASSTKSTILQYKIKFRKSLHSQKSRHIEHLLTYSLSSILAVPEAISILGGVVFSDPDNHLPTPSLSYPELAV